MRRRRWVVLAVVAGVVAIGFVSIRSLERPSQIDYYRVIDDRTLEVGTITGHNGWETVTNVAETPTIVTISMAGATLSLGGTAEGVPRIAEVHLHDPLGSRAVIDASTGLPVKPCTTVPTFPMECF